MEYKIASKEDIERGVYTLYFKDNANPKYKHTYLMEPQPGTLELLRVLIVNSPSSTKIGLYPLVPSTRTKGGFCLAGALDWIAHIEKVEVIDWDGDDDDCL